MRLRHVLSVVAIGLGLSLAPAFTPVLRADDTPKEKPRQGGGPGQFLQRMRENIDKLKITDDQKPKIDAAFADAKTKVDAALKDGAGDREAMRAKMGPIIKELMESVAAVLTPEQKEELEKMRKDRPGPRKDSK